MKEDNTKDQLGDLEKQISAQEQLLNTVQEHKPNLTWWTTTNAMTMSSAILIFGLLVIGLATYLIRKNHSAESILRIFGTILIITIAVFLVVAGYSDNQIAPVMGLLGTIAGYLLGKDPRIKQDEKPTTP